MPDLTPWPPTPAWAHGDVVVDRAGRLLTSDPDGAGLVTIEPDGTSTVRPAPFTEAHSMWLGEDAGREVLWVSDVGFRLVRNDDGAYLPSGRWEGSAVKVDPGTGELLLRLPVPPAHPASDRPFLPTAVVATGDRVWVADGYGGSLLHCHRADGSHELTLTGVELGVGRLANPHALHVDQRRGEPELYVADRENHRLLVLAPDGALRRVVADAELAMPSAMVASDGHLYVAELYGRISVLDEDDRVVDRIGGNEHSRPLWPNEDDGAGLPRRPHGLRPERLNSPHGLAVLPSGQVVVSEWVIGGRLLTVSDG